MRQIAFVEGRVKPQPRLTQKVKFLFGNTVEYWAKVDAENARKGLLGLLNKKGNVYKPTRYAYRLDRLQKLNAYRTMVYESVKEQTGGNIPDQYLFFFYLFHAPKSWSKKKRRLHEWQFHVLKPDYSNLLKGIEDCLYEKDSRCNAVAHYKMYVPEELKEGLLILEDEDIHRHIIDYAIELFIKPPTIRTEPE